MNLVLVLGGSYSIAITLSFDGELNKNFIISIKCK